VINALLSRCRTYILEPIKPEEVEEFLLRNIERIQERYPNIVIARSESVPVTNDVAIQVSETVETGLLRSSQ
jgi:replication-associated recombination protein RarA